MNLECEYNGNTYYRNNSKWVDKEAKEEGDKCKRS